METKTLAIAAPRLGHATFNIIGTAPLMVAKFSAKAQNAIRETQEAGGAAKTKKTRAPRDFAADALAARHLSHEGWDGVHAGAFRNASIDACRAAGFQMTRAKLAIFCLQDGHDRDSGEPLVRILGAEPETSIMPVRNASGVMDLRARPMWREWGMAVKMRFDLDMLSLDDVTNLMMRVGLQVGIGEGRPYGSSGAGMGYGLFAIDAVTNVELAK